MNRFYAGSPVKRRILATQNHAVRHHEKTVHLRAQAFSTKTGLAKQHDSLLFNKAPLHDLLTIVLKKSDNIIADTVFRTIGHERFSVPGTWRAGADAVRQVLRQKAGVNLDNSIVVDGSGLSRHNLISPATMMQALQYIAKHDNELKFIDILSLAGYNGTLQYRAGLHEAGVDGKVSAKTGAPQGVYNLAGFITTASGQRMAFVQFLSCYAVPPEDQRARRVPLARFESRLYKDLYQNN
ncbi:D-alanyl-D-alanine carboxypeptidase/D-alanyl-D-alanine-endopeptidase [Candidatus Symbiopectobacterium sp.]|uniref:D-alanyl-D-alanine carboxypeptidase/D-alanyl-D-alanine endopeptidase n=1 Tax=Candidatus Symbiopectobacterium sp. TaxID=2816440 RepID=UPI0025BD4437|nr:D-alanyl-D-alanine carboxypeptidase/D-alanyl-D-alanine-endopeptidase [Candidatus Symbiopectobacterium sp.]